MFGNIRAFLQRIFTLPKKQRGGIDKAFLLRPGTAEQIGDAVAGAAASAATDTLEHLAEQEAGKL